LAVRDTLTLAALGVASILFSSFGVNPADIWHSFATYLGYFTKDWARIPTRFIRSPSASAS
jgi:hypothetical protein